MIASNSHTKKPAKKSASSKVYDFTILNQIFQGGEIMKKVKELKKFSPFDLRFFMIHPDQPEGRYEEIDIVTGEACLFYWGKPFYVITDEGYLNHTIKDEELENRLAQLKKNEFIQAIFCPPTKEALETIYTMTPDIRIAGTFPSCGKYAASEKEFFSQEELVEKVCRCYNT